MMYRVIKEGGEKKKKKKKNAREYHRNEHRR